jgi:hypothetical protein
MTRKNEETNTGNQKRKVVVTSQEAMLVIAGECDCGLIIREEGGGCELQSKNLRNEGMKPEGFLCHVNSTNIFRFGSGQRYQLLFLGTPRNSTPIYDKRIPRGSMSIFCHVPI